MVFSCFSVADRLNLHLLFPLFLSPTSRHPVGRVALSRRPHSLLLSLFFLFFLNLWRFAVLSSSGLIFIYLNVVNCWILFNGLLFPIH